MLAVPRLPILIFACLALVIAGCGSSNDSSSSTAANGQAASTNSAENSSAEGATSEGKPTKVEEESGTTLTRPGIPKPTGPPPKQLVKNDLIPGIGNVAKSGDEVTVQYVGAGFKTGKEFDASWDRGEPFTFTLGAKEVIPGWDQGIVGMKENSRRELIIPPNLAYGAAGAPPKIGPNETLVFLVDLVSVN
jgi:peptidylprolyl isomerase